MTLIICPLLEVDEAVRIWKPSHVVSLASPGAETAIIPPGIERLQLRFHDINRPLPELQAVTAGEVEQLLDFARNWPREQPLLVQCWAGVSRSPAAAYAIACMLSGAGQEETLAQTLRQAAPFATPNLRLVELADQILQRQGAMVEAILRIGRGAETSMGTGFSLNPGNAI